MDLVCHGESYAHGVYFTGKRYFWQGESGKKLGFGDKFHTCFFAQDCGILRGELPQFILILTGIVLPLIIWSFVASWRENHNRKLVEQ